MARHQVKATSKVGREHAQGQVVQADRMPELEEVRQLEADQESDRGRVQEEQEAGIQPGLLEGRYAGGQRQEGRGEGASENGREVVSRIVHLSSEMRKKEKT